MPDNISQDGLPAGGEIESIPLSDALPTSTPPAQSDAPPAPPPTLPPVTTTPETPEGDDPESNIDFNSFLEASNKDNIQHLPEKKDTKKDDKTTDKKDSVETTEDDKEKPSDKPVQPQTPPVKDGARDFAGIDEKDVPLFKRMSNDSFAALKPVYLENKTLKTTLAEKETKFLNLEKEHKALKEQGPQLPESYFEHPQSYLLDPDFQATVQSSQQAQQILQHWTAQYEAVAEGAKEIEVIDIDPKTGQLYLKGKVPANRGSEVKLLSYVNHAQRQVNQHEVELQTMMKTHSSKATEGVKHVQNLSNTFFQGFYKTPEDKAIYEPLVKEKLSILPPAFQNNPLSRLVAESLVMNQILAQLLNKAKEEKASTTNPPAKPTATKLPANRLNPTNGEINGDGGGGNKEAEVSIDDFERLKNGL